MSSTVKSFKVLTVFSQNQLIGIRMGKIKKGKLIISRRYNLTPLLHSCPGGFKGSWPYKTYPNAKVPLLFKVANFFLMVAHNRQIHKNIIFSMLCMMPVGREVWKWVICRFCACLVQRGRQQRWRCVVPGWWQRHDVRWSPLWRKNRDSRFFCFVARRR